MPAEWYVDEESVYLVGQTAPENGLGVVGLARNDPVAVRQSIPEPTDAPGHFRTPAEGRQSDRKEMPTHRWRLPYWLEGEDATLSWGDRTDVSHVTTRPSSLRVAPLHTHLRTYAHTLANSRYNLLANVTERAVRPKLACHRQHIRLHPRTVSLGH